MKFTPLTVVFECKKGSCCPTLSKKSDDEYTLTDDHGGSVKFTKNELLLMKKNFSKAVTHLNKNL